jgi:hypothetical protein
VFPSSGTLEWTQIGNIRFAVVEPEGRHFPGYALTLPFHARSQASKSGQNNSKRGKDEKRAACSGSDPKLCSVPKRTNDDGQDT